MIRRIALLALVLAAVAAPAASAQAPDYTIRAKGSSSGLGSVSAIGGFKPTVDASLEAATAAFGKPTSVGKTATVCRVGWKPIGLRILFANFGGGDACEFGKAQSASAFGRVWQTSRGLKINSSNKTLRKLYRGAVRKGRTYRLVGAKNVFTNGSRYSVLAAKTNGKQVKSFKLFIGGAGE